MECSVISCVLCGVDTTLYKTLSSTQEETNDSPPLLFETMMAMMDGVDDKKKEE